MTFQEQIENINKLMEEILLNPAVEEERYEDAAVIKQLIDESKNPSN